MGEPPRHSLSTVCLINNVVPLEGGPRPPAAQLHDLALGDARSAVIAGRGAPEVVWNATLEAGALAGTLPGGPEVADATAALMEHEQAIPGGPALFEETLELGRLAEGEERSFSQAATSSRVSMASGVGPWALGARSFGWCRISVAAVWAGMRGTGAPGQ